MSRTLETTYLAPCGATLDLPETRLAQVAIARLERVIRRRRCPRSLSPLYLHGPPGCGKSHLAGGLVERCGGLLTTGRDLGRKSLAPELLAILETTNLLVLEDVTTFPAADGDTLATLLERLTARRVPVVITAPVGPAQLRRHGARLRSRLSGGLVLHLALLGPDSRRAFLASQALTAGHRLSEDALTWLVQQTPGSFRQLVGVIAQLGTPELEPLSLSAVQRRLSAGPPGEELTVERIAREVSRYYRVTPARLRGKSRQRGAIVPRQVSMYLARTLTELSLERIGAYFGGRDHATVLHACRKVEQELAADPALAGAVRTLRAALC